MKLSELIEEANKALKERGDIPVTVNDHGCGCCGFGTVFSGAAAVETDVTVHDYGAESFDHQAVFHIE